MSEPDGRVSAAIGWGLVLALGLGGLGWWSLGWWIAGALASVAVWILWGAYVEDRAREDAPRGPRPDRSATRSTPSARS